MTDQRKTNIFKSLKYHLNELKRLRPEYEYIMIAAQGSQNYNLDLQSDEYSSDIDTVAIVIPSNLEDIIDNKRISETLILDNNEHIDIKDIRLINELFLKQNIKYLEILFTQFRIINPLFKDIICKFLRSKEDIAHYDIQQIARTTFGMAKEKEKAMEHPYEGLKDKIEKYGYDCKQLHHIVRLYYFLATLSLSNEFEYALNSNNYGKAIKAYLLDIKLNRLNLKNARKTCKKYIDLIGELRESIASGNSKLINSNKDFVNELVEDTKRRVFYKSISDKFSPKEEKKEVKVLPSLKHIFVTSDLHFGHENVLSFEPGRYEMLGTSLQKEIIKLAKQDHVLDKDLKYVSDEEWAEYEHKANHLNIKRHDEEIIRRWNEKITHKDVVFILGDFCFGTGKRANEILKQLNGKKILVLGNHDNIFMDKDFDKTLFEEITNYKEIRVNNYHFILFHFPIQVWNKMQKGSIHLYGHIHSNETTEHRMEYEIPRSFNVGVDVNNYYPVCMNDYVEKVNKEEI